jgi:enoyl-CoA hydratase
LAGKVCESVVWRTKKYKNSTIYTGTKKMASAQNQPSPLVVVERVDGGRVVVVGLNRPHARNAVDRPTAEALTRALREELEANPRAKVGVLHGIGGTFCAGADLKAISPGESEEEEAGGGDQREGSSRRNRLLPHGDGPMGPTRLLLSKPVIAAISGASFKPNPLLGGWR